MTIKIHINDNSSIRIEADSTDELEIYDASGKKYGLAGRNAVSLCRCGKTEKAPFCDGSHSRCGFTSKVEAHEMPPKKA